MSITEVETALLDEMDEVRLPDEWGYDYETWRLMSPYMLRSLLIVAVPCAVILFLIVLGIAL